MNGLGRLNEGGFGSCADLMKMHSVIRNKSRNHLNLDSNTKLTNFEKAYNLTLQPHHSFLLNACYYDPNYISAHNKLIYTRHDSQFISIL